MLLIFVQCMYIDHGCALSLGDQATLLQREHACKLKEEVCLLKKQVLLQE